MTAVPPTPDSRGYRPEDDAEPDSRGVRAWSHRHRRPLLLGAAAVAAALCVVWVFVVPDKVHAVTGLQRLAIQWGHPLCWALLCLAALSTAFGLRRSLRDTALWGAAVAYGAFLLATVL